MMGQAEKPFVIIGDALTYRRGISDQSPIKADGGEGRRGSLVSDIFLIFAQAFLRTGNPAAVGHKCVGNRHDSVSLHRHIRLIAGEVISVTITPADDDLVAAIESTYKPGIDVGQFLSKLH